MDASSVVAIVTTFTTGVLGGSNVVLTYKLREGDQAFQRSAVRDGRDFEEQHRRELLRKQAYWDVCNHFNQTLRRMRLEGARRVYDTSDRVELERLADEATRIRMRGTPDVVRAFDAAGDTYRAWSDADDGTLTEARKGE